MSDQNTTDKLTASLPYTECPPVGTIFYWRVDETDSDTGIEHLRLADTKSVVIKTEDGRLRSVKLDGEFFRDDRVHTDVLRLLHCLPRMYRTQGAAIRAGLAYDAKYYRDQLDHVFSLQRALNADE